MKYRITAFDNLKHREQVISLWNEVFDYEKPHNKPDIAINRKIDFDDGLFFVAVDDDEVIGTVMAGYDGHRGWIYSMAVSPQHQNKGIGSALLSYAEERLSEKGCPKINLQILDGNEQVEAFYQKYGYRTEKRISMGKPLIS
jgi:ribosomal protein S18 acetylase RimI-like enzyme